MIGFIERISELESEKMKLRVALEEAYTLMLKMPFDSLRIENQHVLAGTRDAIAFATGRNPEDIQNEFEEKSLVERLNDGD